MPAPAADVQTMSARPPFGRPPRRRALVGALIVAIHCALLLFVTAQPDGSVRGARLPVTNTLTIQLLANRPSEPNTVPAKTALASVPDKTTLRSSENSIRRTQQRATSTPSALSITPSAASEHQVAESITIPPSGTAIQSPTTDLAGSSLQSVGGIDRAFRKQFGAIQPREVPTPLGQLGRSIAAAGTYRSLSPTIRQRTFADGRTVVQVTSAAGTYCVTQPSAGATDGIDHAKNGNAATTTSCGHLFD